MAQDDSRLAWPVGHEARGAEDAAKAAGLGFGMWVTAAIMVVEIAGGWWTHSLALMSDAGHVFGDVFSLALAVFALRLALRPPTDQHTYGLHRAEVFAALFNAAALFVIAAVVFAEAYHRLFAPPEVNSWPMLIIAVVGTVGNLVVALRLRPHSHGDLNLRGAYLHVIGDLLASFAVIAAAIIMALTHRYWVDPALSIGIGLVILVGAGRIGLESLHILVEGVPRGISLPEVAKVVAEEPSVREVHHVHAWSICSDVRAISLHVAANYTNEAERIGLRERIRRVLADRFGFSQITIEMECDEMCPADRTLVYPVSHFGAPGDEEGDLH
jgi:cobalt-zinc-cadmium efflux system protein